MRRLVLNSRTEHQNLYGHDRKERAREDKSPRETVDEKAVERGIAIIKMVDNGFPPFYKPQGAYFDLCATGHLLLLSPFDYRTERVPLLLSSYSSQLIPIHQKSSKVIRTPWRERGKCVSLQKEIKKRNYG